MTAESHQQLDVPQLVMEAYKRCQDHLSPTPLEYSLYLSEKIEGEVWLKLDSMQRILKRRGREDVLASFVCLQDQLGYIQPLLT